MPPPLARYAHGVALPAGARLVLTAGQVGSRPDGTLSADATEQARQCFRNILAILGAEGLGAENILRINGFVTDRAWLPAYMTARDELFATGAAPASTLVIVAGLARPEFLVEIEATAAG
jgi:enamine deaminase RidA (YjgF/YER057c/UK114 family)